MNNFNHVLKFKSIANDEESFAKIINMFLKEGYIIKRVQLVDAPFNEIYATYTTWEDSLKDATGWVLLVKYFTDSNTLRIYTC